MNNFENIQSKLASFVNKYYKNELLKGIILFFSFGLLYFIFTLLVEHFLWLQPTARTILFWLFILVELALLYNYILVPILKLIGLKSGISKEDASQIIGKHFNEVDDKLLNILQLHEVDNQSELLLASIDQKANSLQPIPFKKAIDFTQNKKYLKYLAIPIMIWLVSFFSGKMNIFSDSYERVIKHQIAFEPPAPFSFHVLNSDLQVIQGKTLKLNIETRGDIVPEDAKIHFSNQDYFMANNGLGSFEYSFLNVQKPISFYLEANGVQSKNYQINLIEAPVITNFSLKLDYPSYTKKRDEVVKNTGNIVVPVGTKVTWNINSKYTDAISFITDEEHQFKKEHEDNFSFEKRISKNESYQISTSNANLKNYESLNYEIQVVQDQFPKIVVKSDLDSVSRGPIQFVGQLSDDYGISALNLVYYDSNNKNSIQKHPLKITNTSFQEFYYIFPDSLTLSPGVDYEMYFQVSDNDVINNYKSSRSQTFSYYKKTAQEVENELLDEQKSTIEDMKKSLESTKETKEEFDKLKESLQNKSEMNWNDQKKLNSFIKRQKNYEKMMQQQTEQLQQNLKEQDKNENKSLEERKKEIQKRLEEAKALAKKDKLLKELEKLAEKLDREKLTEKLRKLSEENRQSERNLERILELTKRFYVEQKMNQIQEKLEKLAEKQENLAESEENSSEKQKELNEEFDKIKEELDALEKDNKALQKPKDLPQMSREEKKVDEEQSKATDKLEQQEGENGDEQDAQDNNESKESNESKSSKSPSKNQKSAAQKMKQMSGKMKSSMASMQGETMDEDIDALRAILENLLEFSFQQEDLLKSFSSIDNAHPDFANKLKKQHVLKEYFEHIDDSLYTLSMRQPKISSVIYKDLANVHYHLDESLTHFADNQFNTGISDQQFVMTSTNNLAYLLSQILDNLQNSNPSFGKGSGDSMKGKSFSLPDIIQKQGELIQKMKEGMKKGEEGKPQQQGEKGLQQNGGEGEQMNGELYEIFKEQSQLRQLLNDKIGDGSNPNGNGKEALKQMEELEQQILEQGFTNPVLEKMMQLKHDLLKLENAVNEQEMDIKRESNSNKDSFERRRIEQLKNNRLRFNQNEQLIRQSLPLQTIYKKKVQEYFKQNDSIQ